VVELNPGRSWPLSRADGQPLTRLRMGLGWDRLPDDRVVDSGLPQVDLDASAVEFGGGDVVDIAFYNHPGTRDGSLQLLGDNRSGRGEGDDEVIEIDLDRTHPRVDTILFLVSSYQGHILEWVRSAYCRLVDDEGVEVVRLTITGGGPHTGLVLAKLVRQASGWLLHGLGEGVAVTVPIESPERLKRFL
jgi:tellurium resistance protein TerZ